MAENILMDESTRQRLDEHLEQIGLKMREFPIAATSSLVGQTFEQGRKYWQRGRDRHRLQRGEKTLTHKEEEELLICDGDVLLLVGHAEHMENIALKASRRTEQSFRGRKI